MRDVKLIVAKSIVLIGLVLTSVSCSKSSENDAPPSEYFLFALVDQNYQSLADEHDYPLDSLFFVIPSSRDTIRPISIHDYNSQDSLNSNFEFIYSEFESGLSFSFRNINPSIDAENEYYFHLNSNDYDTVGVMFNDCLGLQPHGKVEGICVEFNGRIAPNCDTCSKSHLHERLLFIK